MRPDSGKVWIAGLDLGCGSAPTGVHRSREHNDTSARLLVRLHGRFLGFVSFPLQPDEDAGDAAWRAVRDQLDERLCRHLEADGVPIPDSTPPSGLGRSDACALRSIDRSAEPISVVVCTRERPSGLTDCLQTLRSLHYPSFEVVVVDNAPETDATIECFARVVGDDARFSYTCEPGRGLSRARNRGLHEATAGIVAFTDDDVLVDPWWLDSLAAGFEQDPRVGCVTGSVPAAELDQPSQRFFESRYGWQAKMKPGIYDLKRGAERSPLHPYCAGTFGTGANFAIDRRLFVDLGGFDEALGAGTPSGGGEDLDAFVRVLRAGRSLVHEPSAVVWHLHRASERALRRQLFYYGAGLTAFLTKYALDTRTRSEILSRVRAGLLHAGGMWRHGGQSSAPAPIILRLAEVLGWAFGPVSYLRGRRQARRRSDRPVSIYSLR